MLSIRHFPSARWSVLGRQPGHRASQPCMSAKPSTIATTVRFRRRLSRRHPDTQWTGMQLRAYATERDVHLEDALNEVSTRAVNVMLRLDEAAARELRQELHIARAALQQEGDEQAARFLAVLQGLLDHTILKVAGELDGESTRALDRVINTVHGCGWRLHPEGQPDVPQDDPDKFSTWEDVMDKKKRGGGGGGTNTSAADATAGVPPGPPPGPVELGYYQVLDVPPTATQAEVRAGYRRMALKLHPDVNGAPDAERRFMELSRAYDVLSEETSRRLYDQYGADGMTSRPGAGAGSGNAREAWDEFKPYKRENKHTRARDASRSSMSGGSWSSSSSEEEEGVAQGSVEASGGTGVGGVGAVPEPVPGDIVEYPLSDLVMEEMQDGRTRGVALLVGRNKDRGDVKRLPSEVLDLCEVEPLRQEESGSDRWIPDELSPSAYCRLGDLRAVAVQQYDSRFDVWVITVPLSPGCGGPELPEEVML